MPEHTVYIYFVSFETNVGTRRVMVRTDKKITTGKQLLAMEQSLLNVDNSPMAFARVINLSLLDEQTLDVTQERAEAQQFEFN